MRALLLAAVLVSSACAQPSTPAPSRTASARPSAPALPTRTLLDDDWCDDVRSWSGQEVACEVRESITRADALDLEAVNGSVHVKRWDRPDVLVRSRVSAHAPSSTRARDLLDRTAIDVDGGVIRADTPDTPRDHSVSVSYEVFAPGRTDLDVTAVNGPVSVHGLSGQIEAVATNGPVQLSGVSGDVAVRAMNGPVDVTLDGRRWSGGGLTVQATNGPITLAIPSGYSARLAASTSLGRISAEGIRLPARDRPRMGDAVRTDLGDGGAPITLRATNGPVRLTTTD